jgi:hypothetical protein
MTPADRDMDTPSPSRRPPPPEDSWLEADVTRKSLLRRVLVVVVAVAVGALWLGTRPGPAAEVVLVSPQAGSRIEGGSTLVWRSVQGASEYQVELVTEGGQVLYSSAVADTTVTLGAEVTSPGAAQGVRWSVVALIPGGQVEWSGVRELVVGGR